MKNIFIFMILMTIPIFSQIARPERILYCKWGEGKQEMGLLIDDQPYGPAFFAIDQERHIYISDDINKAIKKFDRQGNLIFEILPEPGNHIGRVFVLANGRLLYNSFNNRGGSTYIEVDKAGRVRQNYELKFGIKWLDQTDTYIFLNNDLGTVLVLDTVWQKLETFNSRELPYPGCIVVHGIFYFVNFRSDPDKIFFRKVEYQRSFNLSQAFNNAKDVSIPRKAGLIAIRGYDRYNNIYISTKTSPSEPFIFEKFDADLKKIGEIRVNWQIQHAVIDPFVVSTDGDLYVMSSDSKGVWIDKYSASLFEK